MRSRAQQYFIIGQLLFISGIIACVVVDPLGARINYGISYYGIHSATIIPYLVALLGGAIFSALAGLQLPTTSRHLRVMGIGLLVFAVFAIGVAITPDNFSPLVHALHNGFGTLLFASQLATTGWLVFWRLKTPTTIVLWSLELLAGIISGAYLIYPTGYLFLSQITFQVLFGVLMYIGLLRYQTPPATD